METVSDHVWVEMISNIIMARMRGDISEEMLNQRHEQILQLAQDTGSRKLLLDDLEIDTMPYEALEAQRVLNTELEAMSFKIAVVVPNSRLAYLARLQFYGDRQRVFYTDMAEAIDWLRKD